MPAHFELRALLRRDSQADAFCGRAATTFWEAVKTRRLNPCSRFRLENSEMSLLSLLVSVSSSSVIINITSADCANPWAQQLLADVLSLLFLKSAVELHAEWDRSVLSLFGQFAEIFWKIDLNEARATHWSIAVSAGVKEKTMKMWRTLSVRSDVFLSRKGSRRVDSHLRHGAGSLHIKDDLLGARTVFDIWLRFSLSPTRVYCVARPARASGQRVIISSVQSDINDAFST